MGCRIRQEEVSAGSALVIVGIPLGTTVDEVATHLRNRATSDEYERHRRASYLDPSGVRPDPPTRQAAPLHDLRDESTGRAPIRVVLLPRAGRSIAELEAWARAVWPVTMEQECRLPRPAAEMLTVRADACRLEPSGLVELERLVHPS